MIIVNNKMKKALESPVIWPVAGCIILYILICIVSGSVNARVITSGLKLCVFAMLLGVAQMIVVTSGKGAIDISQKYILTLAAYVSCELMQHNILLGLVAAIVVGMICGLINASVNVYLNIHAMITTMATGYLYYTVILLVSNVCEVYECKHLWDQYHDGYSDPDCGHSFLCTVQDKIWYEPSCSWSET